jgi:GNAT superfamily N-acetyltransferase
MQNGYSVTHLVKMDGCIVGFFTLVMASVQSELIGKNEFPDYCYGRLPAMKIARLATHRDFERQRIGEFMIIAALKRAYDLTRHIGCCVITVDAKVDATGFYEKYSFFRVKKQTYPDIVTMYLNLTQYIKNNFE